MGQGKHHGAFTGPSHGNVNPLTAMADRSQMPGRTMKPWQWEAPSRSSAADLKFLRPLQQFQPGISNRKRH
jgi:hypothetical protein